METYVFTRRICRFAKPEILDLFLSNSMLQPLLLEGTARCSFLFYIFTICRPEATPFVIIRTKPAPPTFNISIHWYTGPFISPVIQLKQVSVTGQVQLALAHGSTYFKYLNNFGGKAPCGCEQL